MYFYQYVNNLANQYDLHRTTHGTTSSLDVVLGHGTRVHIRFDEVNPAARAIMHSGSFAPPIDKNGRERFLRFLLSFNRNAIAIIDCGLAPHPHHPAVFTPIWYIPCYEQSEREWDDQVQSYEGLVGFCRTNLTKMVHEWASFIH